MKITPGKFILLFLIILTVGTFAIIGIMYTSDTQYASELVSAYLDVGKSQKMLQSKTLRDVIENDGDDEADDTIPGEGTGDDDSAAGGEPPITDPKPGEKKLNMPQYLNQGDAAYGSITMASGATIKSQGCCMCSYMMCAAYNSGSTWTTQQIIAFATNPANFSGSSVYGLNTFSTKGTTVHENKMTSPSKSDFKNTVINAIDNDHPLIMQIKGHWEHNGTVLHKSQNGHFLVVYGYCDDGFYVLDPGNASVTLAGDAIPWDAINSLPTLVSLREIGR